MFPLPSFWNNSPLVRFRSRTFFLSNQCFWLYKGTFYLTKRSLSLGNFLQCCQTWRITSAGQWQKQAHSVEVTLTVAVAPKVYINTTATVSWRPEDPPDWLKVLPPINHSDTKTRKNVAQIEKKKWNFPLNVIKKEKKMLPNFLGSTSSVLETKFKQGFHF